MTDHECLLIAFGALKVNGAKSVVEIVENHLFGDKPSEPSDPVAETLKIATELYSSARTVPIMGKPVEEKPATPGDYRLKRGVLGPRGDKLIQVRMTSLKKSLNQYEAEISRGAQIHPSALEDIEAARLFLKSSSEQEYKKGST